MIESLTFRKLNMFTALHYTSLSLSLVYEIYKKVKGKNHFFKSKPTI